MGDELTAAYRRSGGARPGHHNWYGNAVKAGEKKHYYEKAGVDTPMEGRGHSYQIAEWLSNLHSHAHRVPLTDMQRIRLARIALHEGQIKLGELCMQCYMIGKGSTDINVKEQGAWLETQV